MAHAANSRRPTISAKTVMSRRCTQSVASETLCAKPADAAVRRVVDAIEIGEGPLDGRFVALRCGNLHVQSLGQRLQFVYPAIAFRPPAHRLRDMRFPTENPIAPRQPRPVLRRDAGSYHRAAAGLGIMRASRQLQADFLKRQRYPESAVRRLEVRFGARFGVSLQHAGGLPSRLFPNRRRSACACWRQPGCPWRSPPGRPWRQPRKPRLRTPVAGRHSDRGCSSTVRISPFASQRQIRTSVMHIG